MTSSIVLTEDGADIVTILHAVVSALWTEESQEAPLDMCHRVVDRVDVIVSEHGWSIADFTTSPAAFRIDGNKQRIFMRERRPKARTHLLQRRWRPEP
jgi:hypothetical protein